MSFVLKFWILTSGKPFWPAGSVIFYGVAVLFLILFVSIWLFHSLLWSKRVLGFSFRVWFSSYECGFLSQRGVESYFSGSYFFLLALFVLLDLEVSLLLNVCFQGVLFKNFLYYLIFIVLLVLGLWLETCKGYVDWQV